MGRYLMSVHIRPRSIYLTRHGESEYNRAKLIGGDSGLTPNGRDYSRELRKFMDRENAADLANHRPKHMKNDFSK